VLVALGEDDLSRWGFEMSYKDVYNMTI